MNNVLSNPQNRKPEEILSELECTIRAEYILQCQKLEKTIGELKRAAIEAKYGDCKKLTQRLIGDIDLMPCDWILNFAIDFQASFKRS